MGILVIGVVLMLVTTSVTAQPAPGDLSGYLPASDEAPGWKPDGAPKTYQGEELFRMINGGADIYHEYGFSQVMRETYMGAGERSINLEIYRMESPAAAYGIYTFKVGEGGKPMTIGQEARLQDYYLNFWKGDLLVTVIGLDSDPETVQGVVALAKAVDARISDTGKRPDLSDWLLGAPLGFSDAKYVRGPLGVMGSYVFDTEDVFRIREGLIGTVDDCRAFVFRYADKKARAAAYEQAVARFDAGSRFNNRVRQADRYAMVDRQGARVVIRQTGRYIAIAAGNEHSKAMSVADRLVETLNQGGSHGSP